MLSQITIRNFAIVDRLQVEWADGFNVITGETGAGKSIIVDAVGALLGDRVGAEVVRTGADRALVEGIFSIPENPQPELARVLEEYGLEPEDGALIVTRDIAAAGGRGGARVNGRSVPLSVLQELGEQLVDVHGQSQHMALMRVREHLELLDRFGGLLAERAEVADLVKQLRATREQIRHLHAQERQAAREQEMLRHQVDEIERVDPRVGEEEEIDGLRNRLRHVEKLRSLVATAHEALIGAELEEGERPGAVELLGEAIAACDEGARIDPSLAPSVEPLNAALVAAEDATRAFATYLEAIEADPAALEQAEERFLVLADLKRKYGSTIDEVLVYLAEARAKLESFENREERLAELAAEETRIVQAVGTATYALSRRRRTAADTLARAVESELTDLSMAGTRFSVAITQTDAEDGVPYGPDRRVEADLHGVDRVEFLIAANAGEEPRPMQRVASGGELARIALAMKTILARADTRATLIFDEVDVGVGGRTAPVVGQKLWSLASAGHQVLCVTHMPQVAAFADSHWVVAKQSDANDSRTRTSVSRLDEGERVEELSAMLAGASTESARGSARELVERAREYKNGTAAPTMDGPEHAVDGSSQTPSAAPVSTRRRRAERALV